MSVKETSIDLLLLDTFWQRYVSPPRPGNWLRGGCTHDRNEKRVQTCIQFMWPAILNQIMFGCRNDG